MNLKIEGIEISNPDKILFPENNISKLDVVNYYKKIAPKMLPFLKDRLVSAIRCHENINGEKFFKKHPTNEGNRVSKFEVDGEDYFFIKNVQELVFQAQMGTLEFHTWGCKIPSINKPDMMIFDLDPDENVTLDKLCDAVKKLKLVLDELGLKSYLKTSGGKGYHVVVPFVSKDWEKFSDFSKKIALLLEARWKNIFTSNIRKDDRKGRIFVDYLRNKKGATCVCAFSLRARKNAPISLPISWDNLGKISPNEVNLKNIDKFLTKTNPWQNIFENKQILK